MTNTHHLTRPTRFALAASLMLGASPILAQVSVDPVPTPVESAPAPVIAAPPPPAIVVPDVAPSSPSAVTPVTPVEEATVVPAQEPVATPEPAPVAARTVAPEPAAAPAARPAPQDAAPAANEVNEASTPIAEPVSAEPVAAPAEEPLLVPVSEAVPPAANDNVWGLFAAAGGVLAILILAIWGFVAVGRRKTPLQRSAVPVVERPVVTPREPVAAPTPTLTPAMQPPQLVASRSAQGGLPHAGASVALPRTLPESFTERAALLKRMIDAKPDRANPFTDRRARAKRARLILQSLGRDFGDTRPWIDLSQYPNNWPELARHTSAAA